MNLPSENFEEYRTVEIPKICLVPISALQLKELTINFKAQISDVSEAPQQDGLPRKDLPKIPIIKKPPNLDIHLPARIEDNLNIANIEMKFEAASSPEGLLRINDQLMKLIP